MVSLHNAFFFLERRPNLFQVAIRFHPDLPWPRHAVSCSFKGTGGALLNKTRPSLRFSMDTKTCLH